jgi:hypothetical protein
MRYSKELLAPTTIAFNDTSVFSIILPNQLSIIFDNSKRKFMSHQLPIGVSDFRKLRENHYYYVDKSLFIKEVMERSSEVLLLPRPRRFGKTLNMSMLRYFLEKREDNLAHLFKGLAISKDTESMQHQGQYPVIF